MRIKNKIEIQRCSSHVWSAFADVEDWPLWTASVTQVRPLDGAVLSLGRRYEIKQPFFPKATWVITHLTANKSWVWEQHFLGGKVAALHEITSLSESRSLVRQCVEFTGPLGITVGKLMQQRVIHYLSLEAHGLKRRCEKLTELDGPVARYASKHDQ